MSVNLSTLSLSGTWTDCLKTLFITYLATVSTLRRSVTDVNLSDMLKDLFIIDSN